MLRGEANQGSDAYRKVLKSLVDSRSISDELPLTALPNRHTDVVRFDAGAADDEFDVGGVRGGGRPPSPLPLTDAVVLEESLAEPLPAAGSAVAPSASSGFGGAPVLAVPAAAPPPKAADSDASSTTSSSETSSSSPDAFDVGGRSTIYDWVQILGGPQIKLDRYKPKCKPGYKRFIARFMAHRRCEKKRTDDKGGRVWEAGADCEFVRVERAGRLRIGGSS